MNLNIILISLAIITIVCYVNKDKFSREDSSFIRYTETEYGGNLTAMDRGEIDDPITIKFKEAKRVLDKGTDQNVGGYVYKPFHCGGAGGRGDRCNKMWGSCLRRENEHATYCKSGLLIDMGNDCACLMLKSDNGSSMTKRKVTFTQN